MRSAHELLVIAVEDLAAFDGLAPLLAVFLRHRGHAAAGVLGDVAEGDVLLEEPRGRGVAQRVDALPVLELGFLAGLLELAAERPLVDRPAVALGPERIAGVGVLGFCSVKRYRPAAAAG